MVGYHAVLEDVLNHWVVDCAAHKMDHHVVGYIVLLSLASVCLVVSRAVVAGAAAVAVAAGAAAAAAAAAAVAVGCCRRRLRDSVAVALAAGAGAVAAGVAVAAVVAGAQYDWKKFHGLDHVALKTSTSIHRLQQKIIKQQQPVHIHVPENHPSKIKQRETVKNQMSDAFTKAWYADYENDFTKAIDNNKLEAADNIWHLACENTLGSILHAQQLNQIGNQRPVRGTTLPAHEVSHAIPFNAKQGEATTNATATRQQHSGRLREIKARMQRWCCSTDPIAQQKQEAKPIYI